jgi:diketogulonate reductase-like aldo/keto reductase
VQSRTLPRMNTRREFIEIAAAAGAALAIGPRLDAAQRVVSSPRNEALLQRAIPSTGEMLPVIGLGRGSRPADPAALKEVVKTLVDYGGRIVDTTASGPAAENEVGAAAHELGIQNKIFWSTPVTLRGGAATVRAQVDASCARLKVPTIDLAMVVAINTTDIAAHLDVLREMKKERRVRYIGVTDLLLPPSMPRPVAPNLVSLMRNEPLDFVGFDYSIGDRRAEETLLPVAQEQKIGVLAYFTLERSRLSQRVGTTPLPEWAAEFDAKTWAQFFLKYVVGHPAVTVARAGTGNPAHMLDNIGGGIGRLPNEAMRKRMAALVDALPSGR